MTDRDFTDHRLTERRNSRTVEIDVASSIEIVRLLNEEDKSVADAVFAAREALARATDLVVAAFGSGGHL